MFLKQSTGTAVLLGPFVDSTDGGTAETSLTVANIDVDVYKFSDTHPLAKVDITPAGSGSTHDMAHVANGYYSLELTATDTNTCGRLKITANISGALPVWNCFQVVEESIYASLFAASAAGFNSSGQVAVNSLTSAAITDVWSTDPLVEAYANDGSAGTAAQMLYMLWAAVNEFSISGDRITAKKLDGSTTAIIWEIDSASSPTSRTRIS